MFLVKKKHGNWKLCVDFCALNTIPIKDHFSMPTILMDNLGGVAWFTKLDLQQGFHRIHMAEGDIHKTSFQTYHGHYEYRGMSFGLCNVSSTF